MSDNFDVIVVGARCAGSPAAMLLARKGYKVLVVDRATFPSDTLSTHVIHPHGVARLAAWGLLDRVVASGCPPIDTYAFHFGPLVISGSPGSSDATVAYCPRRTVLDKILVDGARDAGAEVWEGFVVDELVTRDGRVTGIRGHAKDGATALEVPAPIVIGADGRNSVVARAVAPAIYDERPTQQGGYYGYWSGVDIGHRFETHVAHGNGAGVAPTHDGLTMIVTGWPLAEYEVKKHDHERNYLAAIEQLDTLRGRMRGARLESKVYGGATPNFYRTPFGPGWALVGDAGYIKDPITAQGITDAFRDAELVTAAIDAWRCGTRSYEDAMRGYQTARDAQSLPMYEFTVQLASLAPPPPEQLQLLAAICDNQDAMDQFCRVNAGILSPAEFFAEANVGRILAAAQRDR